MKHYNYSQFHFLTNTASPATYEEVRRMESGLSIAIPDIYKSFLYYTNGANTDYVRLCDVTEIAFQHQLLDIENHLPGYVCIASENGDYELIMESKADATTVFLVDAGSMKIKENTQTLTSIYEWLLSGDGHDPGDPFGADDARKDWDDWADVVLVKTPENGIKGLAHLRQVLELPVSAAHLYQQSKSLPYVLIENCYRGKAERLVGQLQEPGLVRIADKNKRK